MKKILFGAVAGILAVVGVCVYAKKKAEEANDVDIVIDVNTNDDEVCDNVNPNDFVEE